MDSRPLRLCLSALAVTASGLLSSVACTFPSVDYEDSAPMTTGGCIAPANCAMDAEKCGNDARAKLDSCSHGCTNKPPACQMSCDVDLDTKLGQCNASCESCSLGRGCVNAASSCKALTGG